MDFEIPKCEFAFEIRVECGPPQVIGQTPDGLAMMIPILGGTVSGPGLKGRVISGGADWPIRRGSFTLIDAQYAIEADDGVIIRIHNRGVAFDENGQSAPQDGGRRMPSYVRTVPQFIAPDGPHAWLNRTIFVGTLQADPSQAPFVVVRVFKVV